MKESLTRDEMRQVSGGSGDSPNFGTCSCSDGREYSVASCWSCDSYCNGGGWICSGGSM